MPILAWTKTEDRHVNLLHRFFNADFDLFGSAIRVDCYFETRIKWQRVFLNELDSKQSGAAD